MTVYTRPGTAGRVDVVRVPLRQLHRRRVGAARRRASTSRTRPRSPARRSARWPGSTEADIDKALDAAHGAAPAWGKTAPAERAVILNKIADRIEDNLEMLAVAETWDNGKPIRETLTADLPLAVDHFRYFAGAIRAQEGRSRRSTTTPSPTTSTSRSAWSGRSSRGTSRS